MELERVKSNVSKMVGQGAPEADIDAYIEAEGTTVDAIKSYKPDKPWNEDVADFLTEQSKPDSELGSFFGGVGQGITLGASDEIAAKMGVGDLEKNQNLLAKIRESHPVAYGAGEVTGAVSAATTGGGIATRAAPGASKSIMDFMGKNAKTQIGAGSGIGGVSGGAYAFNTGTGNSDERLEKVPLGATMGGVGGIAGVAAPAIGGLAAAGAKKLGKPVASLAERAMNLFGKKERTVAPMSADSMVSGGPPAIVASAGEQDKAMSLLANAINKDFGPEAPAVMAALKDGSITLGDIAKLPNRPTVRGLVVGAAQYPKGKAVVEQSLGTEMADRGARVSESMGKNIANFGGFYGTIDDIVSKGQAKAAPLYDTAYKANTVMDSPELRAVLETPAAKKALATASNKILNDMDNVSKLAPAERDALMDEAKSMGQVMIGEGTEKPRVRQYSLRALDYTKRGLDDAISDAKKFGGSRDEARILTGLKNKLLSAMDAADKTGNFAKARATASDYLSVENAAEEGQKIFNTRPELVRKTFNSFETDAEKQAYKMGLVESMRKKLDGMSFETDPYRAIMQGDGNKQRLGALLSPSEYRAFEKDLKAEQRLFKLYKDALQGTQTTPRSKAAQAFENTSMIADLVTTGGAKATVMSGIKSGIKKAFDGLSDNTAGILADAVYETNPTKKLAIIQSLKPKPGVLTREEVKQAKAALAEVERTLRKKRISVPGAAAGGVVAAPEQKPLKVKVTPENKTVPVELP